MNDCEHTREAHAYCDGELSPEEAARFEAHLADCAACRAELEAARALSSLLGEASPAALPREVAERLRALAGGASVIPLAKKLTALAAGVLVACAVWFWSAGERPPSEEALGWQLMAVASPEEYSADESQLTAQWIIADLSRENGYE